MLPALLYGTIMLIGLCTPPSVQMGNWLVLVPFVAAAVCSPAATAALGVLVVATNRLVNATWPTAHLRPEDFALEIAAVLVATVVAALRVQARDYTERVQSAAKATRQVVLRPVPPGWGGVDSAARYLAANVEAQVGGDFYDVVDSPHGARVLLGDVQGKGLPAVSTAASLVGTFREVGWHEADLATVAARLEHRLGRQNRLQAQLGETEERFATAVVIAFPHDGSSHIDMLNFGHEGPLVIGGREAGVRRLPQEQGPPLGMAELAGGLPSVRRVALGRDETVLLVTDGVTEARDRAGEFFPLRRWLEGVAADHPAGIAPAALLPLLVEAVLNHTDGHLSDDAALLAVRVASAEGIGTSAGGAGTSAEDAGPPAGGAGAAT
ncbi:serine/threonine-protein phosphatase [Streptomyces sp. A7024]|uniref:Serine/threonine-protein phosphatase n=1 Tax=Streptomyces coryli TaxID=1128680 RepID=A0A6G4U3C5_9ACTN|nr:serine/threonine-protein phosphatase [Streptomyces coryli]